MKHEISRRAMVGSVVAAGAAGTVGWFRGWDTADAAGAAGAAGAAPTAPDELTVVIGEEIRHAVREMTQRPGPGARRFAGALRMYAANGRAHGLDQGVADYYRTLVKTQGRDAVLSIEPDWAMLQAEARALGIDRVTPMAIDMPSRARALDAMLAGKYTAFLDRTALEVDARSKHLDERGVPGVRPIVYSDAACIRTMEMENWAQWGVKVVCAFGWVVYDVPACAAAVGAWAGVWLVNELEGCH